jgi:hypothetical protein
MNPTGTNTESSTNEIAITGPVICRIAFLVASLGSRSGSSAMTRSAFSTTTIASSTTTPMPRTIASSETVLAENPAASKMANVPTRLTGMATMGMIVARRFPRNRKTTRITSAKAMPSVFSTSVIVAATNDELS